MKKQVFLTILLVLSNLTACTIPSKSLQKKGDIGEYQEQIDQINRVSRATRMFFVSVSAPGNIVADAMMVAALPMSGSNAVDSLVTLLDMKSNLSIGVVGHSRSVTIATLKAALMKVETKDFPKQVFVYVGIDEKIKLETPSNINVIVVGPVAKQ